MDDRAPASSGAAGWLPGWWWQLSVRGRRMVATGAAAVLVVAGWVVLAGGGAADDAAAEPPSGAAAFVASLPPSRVELWDRLAECESGGQWDLSTGGLHHGGLQFTAESWAGVGGTGLPHEHPREEQIMRAELLRSIQGFGAWPGCADRLGLR